MLVTYDYYVIVLEQLLVVTYQLIAVYQTSGQLYVMSSLKVTGSLTR